mgnify:CR=1 FL=1
MLQILSFSAIALFIILIIMLSLIFFAPKQDVIKKIRAKSDMHKIKKSIVADDEDEF